MEKITSQPLISISVVSHGQMDLIMLLMQDIEKYCNGMSVELVLTLNTDEPCQIDRQQFSYPVTVIKNVYPKGFGANHNQAFQSAHGACFCIVNPDIRLHDCPLQPLLRCLDADRVGVVAPVVLGPSGAIEDSSRRFPTPRILLGKLLQKNWQSDYVLGDQPMDVDWVAGMFMVFPSQVFKQLGGFDERYFLYYEDVDVCARLNLAGFRVVVCPNSRVVHHAQRKSHRHLIYLRWHISSVWRFFRSDPYQQLKQQNRL